MSGDFELSSGRVLVGNCLVRLADLADASVDSVVTDPPYELGFMGKQWDASGIAYQVELWQQCLRVLKPGGHLLAFGGTRTYHRMACAIEDAGFEIRDSIHWVYGSGFPKSHNVGKNVDKHLKAERVPTGDIRKGGWRPGGNGGNLMNNAGGGLPDIIETAPATPEAARWEGWGTALKPAHEPIVVARKPLDGTVAGNVLEWGTGGLNIDGCRVPTEDNLNGGTFGGVFGNGQPTIDKPIGTGRWPANIVLDGAAAAALDQQSGSVGGGNGSPINAGDFGKHGRYGKATGAVTQSYADKGGASRFFTQADFGPDDWPFVYQAKPSKAERNAGLDGLPDVTGTISGPPKHGYETATFTSKNHHPTVKPVALMRHLVRLVTPPGGTVLDPFAGSGTTLVAAILEGFDAIGCEMTDEYLPIIEGRITWAEGEVAAGRANKPQYQKPKAKVEPQQPTLTGNDT